MSEEIKFGPASFRSSAAPMPVKSTLLNALVGQKSPPSSPISPKPRVPRFKAWPRCHAQIVFIDTPGIHKADSQLNKRLMDWSAPLLRSATCCSSWWTPNENFGEQDRARCRSGAPHPSTPALLAAE